jgi:putative zinc finger/helix-turn-helix YgiT family protein
MICTNCFEAEYKTAKTELTVTVNGESHVLRDLDCETCPACGEITFTHAQSLVIDKKRIALEFGLKPLLTPDQLKTLRRVLDMKLDEICDLLHIGRNTYGRWERGEVEITPSMNLLVHNLIEKVPTASANLALSQTKSPQRVTSPNAATAATKVLSYGRTSKDSKTAAGSALPQRPAKGKK